MQKRFIAKTQGTNKQKVKIQNLLASDLGSVATIFITKTKHRNAPL
jgi:hypothetical protein